MVTSNKQKRREQRHGRLPADKQMMDILPFPVFMLDENDRFLWLNHAAEGFFQSSQAMLVSLLHYPQACIRYIFLTGRAGKVQRVI